MADRPTLIQVHIIQSLAEALSLFEKEISWGVSPGEHDIGSTNDLAADLYIVHLIHGRACWGRILIMVAGLLCTRAAASSASRERASGG